MIDRQNYIYFQSESIIKNEQNTEMGLRCLYECTDLFSRFGLLLARQQIHDIDCQMGVDQAIAQQIASLIAVEALEHIKTISI